MRIFTHKSTSTNCIKFNNTFICLIYLQCELHGCTKNSQSAESIKLHTSWIKFTHKKITLENISYLQLNIKIITLRMSYLQWNGSTENRNIFLYDFNEILKRTLHNHNEIMKKHSRIYEEIIKTSIYI